MLVKKGGGKEDGARRLQLSLVMVKMYPAALWKSASSEQNPVGVGWRDPGSQSMQKNLTKQRLFQSLTTKICYLAATIADEGKIDIYLNTKLWWKKNHLCYEKMRSCKRTSVVSKPASFSFWCVLSCRELSSEDGCFHSQRALLNPFGSSANSVQMTLLFALLKTLSRKLLLRLNTSYAGRCTF